MQPNHENNIPFSPARLVQKMDGHPKVLVNTVDNKHTPYQQEQNNDT